MEISILSKNYLLKFRNSIKILKRYSNNRMCLKPCLYYLNQLKHNGIKITAARNTPRQGWSLQTAQKRSSEILQRYRSNKFTVSEWKIAKPRKLEAKCRKIFDKEISILNERSISSKQKLRRYSRRT